MKGVLQKSCVCVLEGGATGLMSKEPWSHVLQLAFLVQVDELKFSLVSVWLFFVFF